MQRNFNEYQRERNRKLREQGWKSYNCMAPIEIVEQLKEFRDKLLLDWKVKQRQEAKKKN